MYKDTKISLEVYKKYYELVDLLKQKGASSSKLNELETLLLYFNDNFGNFNKEEKSLIKNVIIIATGIANKTNTYYRFTDERRNKCLTLTKKLKEKQKEPFK